MAAAVNDVHRGHLGRRMDITATTIALYLTEYYRRLI